MNPQVRMLTKSCKNISLSTSSAKKGRYFGEQFIGRIGPATQSMATPAVAASLSLLLPWFAAMVFVVIGSSTDAGRVFHDKAHRRRRNPLILPTLCPVLASHTLLPLLSSPCQLATSNEPRCKPLQIKTTAWMDKSLPSHCTCPHLDLPPNSWLVGHVFVHVGKLISLATQDRV